MKYISLIIALAALTFVVPCCEAQDRVSWRWFPPYADTGAVYGAPGQFSADYHPTGRGRGNLWRDTLYTDLFWVFGGASTHCQTNGTAELWAYNMTLHQWAYVAGPKEAAGICPTYGSYAAGIGVYSTANYPSHRMQALQWAPATTPGIAYVYGGQSFGTPQTGAWPVDSMWSWDSYRRMWAYWGSVPTNPTNAVPGEFSSLNSPGQRRNAATPVTADGTMYLYAGDWNGSPNSTDDIWAMKLNGTTPFSWKCIRPATTDGFYVYGTKGVESPLVKIGFVRGFGEFLDSNGYAWVTGGDTARCNGTTSFPGVTVNDCGSSTLFRINLTTGYMAYFGGSNAQNGQAKPTEYNFGARNVYAPTNWPWPARDPYMIYSSGSAARGIAYMFYGDIWVLNLSGQSLAGWALNTRDSNDPKWMWISGHRALATLSTNVAAQPAAGAFFQVLNLPPSCTSYHNGRWSGTPNPYVFIITSCGDQFSYRSAILEMSLLQVTFLTQPASGNFGQTISTPVVSVAVHPTAWTDPINDPDMYVDLVLDPPVGGVAINGTRAPILNGVASFPAFSVSAPGTYTVRVDVVVLGHVSSHIMSQPFTLVSGDAGARVSQYPSAYPIPSAPGVFSTSVHPGYRRPPVSWRDTRTPEFVWYFGGAPLAQVPYIDCQGNGSAELWVLNTTSMAWAYMLGVNDTANCTAMGTNYVVSGLGQFATGNLPSGRQQFAMWAPANQPGYAYMFGGLQYNPTGAKSDQWIFSSAQMKWAYWGIVTINPTIVASGFSTSNSPGNRRGMTTWVDSDGIMYMYGGDGNLGREASVWALNGTTAAGFAWKCLVPTNNVTFTHGGFGSSALLGFSGWAASAIDGVNNHYAWTFGGYGQCNGTLVPSGQIVNGTVCELNLVHRIDLRTGVVTYFGGGGDHEINELLTPFSYGVKHVPASSNLPRIRDVALMIEGRGVANKGIIYLVGGGTDARDYNYGSSDVWALVTLDSDHPKWIWIGGTSDFNVPTVPSVWFSYVPGIRATSLVAGHRNPYILSAISPYAISSQTYIEISVLSVAFIQPPISTFWGQLPTITVGVAALPTAYTLPINDPGMIVTLTLDPPVSGVTISGNTASVVNGIARFPNFAIGAPGLNYALRVDVTMNGMTTTHAYSANFSLTTTDPTFRVLNPQSLSLNATYGSPLVFNPSYRPTTQQYAQTWRDTLNPELIWTFGGLAGGNPTPCSNTPGHGACGFSNELWVINTFLSQWAYMTGPRVVDYWANYPSQCFAYMSYVNGSSGQYDSSFHPSARGQAFLWTPKSMPGVAFMLGGSSFNVSVDALWSFDSYRGQWARWDSPYSATNVIANDFSALNSPGSRAKGASWLNPADDTMWLFGGVNTTTKLSDIWAGKVVGNQFLWKLVYSGQTEFNVFTTVGAPMQLGRTWWSRVAADLVNMDTAWGFGGTDSPPSFNKLGELWSVNMTTGAVTYWGGSSNAPGSFTSPKHVYSAGNSPAGVYVGFMMAGVGAANQGISYNLGGTVTAGTINTYAWAAVNTDAHNPRWVWIAGTSSTCFDTATMSGSPVFQAYPNVPGVATGVMITPGGNPYVYTITQTTSCAQETSAILEISILVVRFIQPPRNGQLGGSPIPVTVAVGVVPTGYTQLVSDAGVMATLVLDPPISGVTLANNSAPVVNGYAYFPLFNVNGVGNMSVRVDISFGDFKSSHAVYANFSIACRPECATCNQQGCLTCASGVLSYRGQCVFSCPNTTYMIGSTCYDCSTGCLNCTTSGLLRDATNGPCRACDEANSFAVYSGYCFSCPASGSFYFSGVAGNRQCGICDPIPGCNVANASVTCTAGGNSRCPRCSANYYKIPANPPSSNADSCYPCSHTCGTPTKYISTPCYAGNNDHDDICSDCTKCGDQGGINATYTVTSCSLYANTICGNCSTVTNCTIPYCSDASVTRCRACVTGQFVVSNYPASSDSCQDCSECGVGTFRHGGCLGDVDTICPACTTGCANCTGVGLNITAHQCQACDEAHGWALNRQGGACVAECPAGEYRETFDGTAPAQCQPCSVGCAVCTGVGLSFGAGGVCLACNNTETWLVNYEGDQCVPNCLLGQFRNETHVPIKCSSCNGANCAAGTFVGCTHGNDSECTPCSTGCGTCTGYGLNLTESCSTCDTAAGYAPDPETGLCTRCAANCSLCSDSPTTCLTCAEGYRNAPGCAPYCSSPGCLNCFAPEACGALCDGAYQGSACDSCSALATSGSKYPLCISSRQTDPLTTGVTMGALVLLVIVVLVVSLWRPLDIFYTGVQQMEAASTKIPLQVDFTLTTRHLRLTFEPVGTIVSAYLEGRGLMKESLSFKEEPLAEKSDKTKYVMDLTLTKNQSSAFLAGNYHVDLTIVSVIGNVICKHPLKIHMRRNSANALAVFTLIVEFIQLSAGVFGSNITWWQEDPVPGAMHYSIITLPAINDLWYIIFWLLAGLGLFFTIMVVLIKLKLDRCFMKCGPGELLYSTILPFLGQTLYMPILSVMLSVMACSKPVTVAGAQFSANFDPEHVTCWAGNHWIYVAVSLFTVLTYYPAAVWTLPLWQIVNDKLDIRYFPTFLIVSAQSKFILTVTSQMFAAIPFVQSLLLIILSLPVIVLIIARPPSTIYHLRWPTLATYAAVVWAGIASIFAILRPNSYITNIVLYAGWALLLIGSLAAALRPQKTDEDAMKASSAVRRVMDGPGAAYADGHPDKDGDDDNEPVDSDGADPTRTPSTLAFAAVPDGLAVELSTIPAPVAAPITDAKSTPTDEKGSPATTPALKDAPVARAKTPASAKPAAKEAPAAGKEAPAAKPTAAAKESPVAKTASAPTPAVKPAAKPAAAAKPAPGAAPETKADDEFDTGDLDALLSASDATAPPAASQAKAAPATKPAAAAKKPAAKK